MVVRYRLSWVTQARQIHNPVSHSASSNLLFRSSFCNSEKYFPQMRASVVRNAVYDRAISNISHFAVYRFVCSGWRRFIELVPLIICTPYEFRLNLPNLFTFSGCHFFEFLIFSFNSSQHRSELEIIHVFVCWSDGSFRWRCTFYNP